jgi:hypothetical protein
VFEQFATVHEFSSGAPELFVLFLPLADSKAVCRRLRKHFLTPPRSRQTSPGHTWKRKPKPGRTSPRHIRLRKTRPGAVWPCASLGLLSCSHRRHRRRVCHRWCASRRWSRQRTKCRKLWEHSARKTIWI